MLPTPDTSHVNYNRVYEPSEDSFLLLDTLSLPSETRFLQSRFPPRSPAPLVVELGTGSGVVLAFVHAHAARLFGRADGVLAAGVDVNAHACRATGATVRRAGREHGGAGAFLGASLADLGSCWRAGAVDVVIFNPPYVPTSEMPARPAGYEDGVPGAETGSPRGDQGVGGNQAEIPFEHESYLLELAYAGGRDGMQTTDRLVDGLPALLSPRGVAYVLLCAQNRPEEVKARIAGWGGGWTAETVGSSGKTAGWEKLQIVRIWRDREEVE